jgi:hypothetical protein
MVIEDAEFSWSIPGANIYTNPSLIAATCKYSQDIRI